MSFWFFLDQQISQLQQQLTEVENRFAQSQQEKTQMEAEFEYKRAKIKELYFAKESKMSQNLVELLLIVSACYCYLLVFHIVFVVCIVTYVSSMSYYNLNLFCVVNEPIPSEYSP